MKKILPLLLLTLVIAVGCSSASKAIKADSEEISFEYVAMTRGAYKKVIVKQDTVITIQDREMKDVLTKGLKNGEWNKLLAALDKVDAEKISELKAPSNKNHADAALAATLKIIRKDKTYESNTFDHGNPPAELKEIVSTIIAVSDLEYK